MTRSKKIFVAFALVFVLALAYMAYDISSRTTFPGAPHQPAVQDQPATVDSLKRDSLQSR